MNLAIKWLVLLWKFWIYPSNRMKHGTVPVWPQLNLESFLFWSNNEFEFTFISILSNQTWIVVAISTRSDGSFIATSTFIWWTEKLHVRWPTHSWRRFLLVFGTRTGLRAKCVETVYDENCSWLLVTTVFDRKINCGRATSTVFQESIRRLRSFPHGILLDIFSVINRNRNWECVWQRNRKFIFAEWCKRFHSKSTKRISLWYKYLKCCEFSLNI